MVKQDSTNDIQPQTTQFANMSSNTIIKNQIVV